MRRVVLLLPLAAFALAACDPNFQAGPRARDMPPAWTPPPGQGDESPHGGGASGMERVIATLKAKIAADTKNEDLGSRRQLAAIYDEQGEWVKAGGILQEAEAIAPKDLDLKVRRADVLMKLKDQGAAKVEIEEAAKLDPNAEGVLRAWGSYYLMTEELEKAISARRRLLAKYPDLEDAETIEL